MATKAIEAELLQLEKQFWQAIKDRDLDAALRLTDDPCVVAGPQGVQRVDKETFKSMMERMPTTLQDFAVNDDAQVRLLGKDVAIVAYTVNEELTTEDGETVTLEAADTSTWVRQNGRWVCAMHTETILGDPIAPQGEPNTVDALP